VGDDGVTDSIRRALVVSIVVVVIGAWPGHTAEDGANVAGRIVGAALVNDGAWHKLAWLSDRVGPRLSGSPQLERAIEWAVQEFRRDGLDAVWTETVRVPHWVRGPESGRIVAPVEYPLALLALGMSEPTPEAGVAGRVVEVASFEQLEALGKDAVSGKIVLYNKPIARNGGEQSGYGSAVDLRSKGASAAAKLGAVGMLIRSLGTASFRLPHTGAMRYEDGVPRIPAAAIAAEDAELIHRLLASGETVRVHFSLGCQTLPDAESANVVADLKGRERPDEIVVIAAHLDSWDVGTGAIDDGAGVAIVMETMRLLKANGFVPRRTVRAVLFTNEENGVRGGEDYAKRHAEELGRHVAAIEVDSGAGAPKGFRVSAGPGGEEIVRRLAAPLDVIDADAVESPGGGADISKMRPAGVPLLGLWQDSTYYFDYHHTQADTLDKADPDDLRENVAALALLAYGLADLEQPLPRLEPEQP
jgi:hypothetical protein